MEYLSKECYDRMLAELDELITVEFPRLTKELAEARAQGDLSENFEYHACKRAQGRLMSKIRFKQRVLQNAKVIDTDLLNEEVAGLFRRVTVTNLANQSQRIYTIVNPHEAEMASGKLSVKSPIGTALAGKRVGETVEISVPAGVLTLKIEKIEIA